jgi:hypothetical protein
MSSHLRLAQNDERESEDDGRGDHGSELGKYRPESARSELQCLAPCSPTKIFHVGLHVATSCLAYRPATAGARPKGGRSTQGNNSPVNKRTFAISAKSAQRHGTPPLRRAGRPGSPCFRRGCPDCALASAGPWRQINDADIRSVASKIRTPSRRLSSFIGLPRPLPMRLARALEGCA